MSIIFGGFTKSKDIELEIEKLSRTHIWDDAAQKKIHYKGFYCEILVDKKFPYQPNNFIYISKEHSLLVLVSGQIYNRYEIDAYFSENTNHLPLAHFILLCFLKWGTNFVKKINGDFGIVIYSNSKQKIFLFRDPIGVRPLAYVSLNDTFFFSLDVISLSKALFNTEKVNQKYIRKKFISIAVGSYNITPNTKVKKVLPGHFIVFEKNKIVNKKYWFPEKTKTDKKINSNTLFNDLKILVENAVKIRLEKELSIASHISGGLDSSIVAGIAKKYLINKPFFGFSWVSDKKKIKNLVYDERDLIYDFCKHYDIVPVFDNSSVYDYLKNLSHWRTSTDLAHEYNVVKKANNLGVNMILSGWGGDEFISINSDGIDSDLILKMQWRSFIKKHPNKTLKELLSVIFHNVISPAFSHTVFNRKNNFEIFKKYLNIKTTDVYLASKNLNQWFSRKNVHSKLLYNYHLPARMEDFFIIGYRNGIEYRYPLLDKRIVEYMFKVPSKSLVNSEFSRIILREIGENIIPDNIRFHKSKLDPARVALDYKIYEESINFILDEFEEFKANSDLNIINLDALKLDTFHYLECKKDSEFKDYIWLLITLKKINEFTKHYYSKC